MGAEEEGEDKFFSVENFAMNQSKIIYDTCHSMHQAEAMNPSRMTRVLWKVGDLSQRLLKLFATAALLRTSLVCGHALLRAATRAATLSSNPECERIYSSSSSSSSSPFFLILFRLIFLLLLFLLLPLPVPVPVRPLSPPPPPPVSVPVPLSSSSPRESMVANKTSPLFIPGTSSGPEHYLHRSQTHEAGTKLYVPCPSSCARSLLPSSCSFSDHVLPFSCCFSSSSQVLPFASGFKRPTGNQDTQRPGPENDTH